MLSRRSAGRLLGRSSWLGPHGPSRNTSLCLQPRLHPLLPATARPPTTAIPRIQGPNVSGSRSFSWASITAPVTDALVAVHSATGIPWFALIPAVTLAFQMSMMLPFRLPTRLHINRVARLIDARLVWYARACRLQLPDPGKRATKEFQRVRREAGVREYIPFIPAFVQLPPWFLTIGAIRNLCIPESPAIDPALVDPSFATEGVLWFQDLSVADPVGILPMAAGVMFAWNIVPKTTAEVRQLVNLNAGGFALRFRRFLLILTPFMWAALAQVPAGINLFLLSSFLWSRTLGYLTAPYLPPLVKNPWTVGVKGKMEPWHVGGPK